MSSFEKVGFFLLATMLVRIQCNFPENCTDRNVRLVGGQSDSDGRVEVCANGTWASICQQYWDARDARVICRQIGYDSETAVGIQPWPDPGTGPIYQLSSKCAGNESSIFNCTTRTQYPDVLDCDHLQVVGVICIPQGDNCTDGDIRLVDGPSEYEGRLEICYRGLWGTVCGDHVIEQDSITVLPSFDSTAALIACRQLGYHYIGANISYYGPGSGPIHLDSVTCIGNEATLDECAHSDINEHQCSHLFDIGITCTECLDNDVRIVGPSPTYGRVELCVDEQWGTICDNFWDARDARVVCRQLGFESETAIGIQSYGGGTGLIHRNFVECNGNESTLSQCPSCTEEQCVLYSACPGHQYDVAVDCFPQGNQCAEGDIRLTNGENEFTGGLEYCHVGYWGTVCGYNWNWVVGGWTAAFTLNDASVACRQLGFSPEDATAQFNSVVGSGPIFLGDVRCNGTENRLIDCPHSPPNEFRSCHHWGNIGVTCKACTDYDVRLADGPSQTEGRVEVCLGGEWGTICHNYWDARDARVVCRQLGYESDTAIGIHSYGGGQGLINLDYVHCDGGETHLSECPPCTFCAGAQFIGCDHHQDAGVICFPNGTECNEANVRLVGGSNEREGIVEICHNGLWGTVCGWHTDWGRSSNCQYFTHIEASVICKQLGYSGQGAVGMYAGQFPLITGLPIYLDDVRCSGTEDDILDCSYSDWNVHQCWHIGNVGITCLDREYLNSTSSGSNSTDCSIGSVRLVGGQSESDGRVEVCANGTWASVCQQFWDARDARVICRQIGYDSETAVGVQPWPDPGTGPIHQLSLDCIGIESSVFDCSRCSCFGPCLDSASCGHSQDVGVICFPQGDNCTDGDIRLVDGPSEYEGRLEICYRGLWGTVCGDHVIEQDSITVLPSFDSTAAVVVCRQLGHRHNGANISYYGPGSGPIYLDNVNCTGEETALEECAHSNINEHQCSHSFDIGITCPGCQDDDIRIVGPTQTYGRVEICVDGVWGTVCDNYWDAREARVACRQLGFESETAIAIHTYGGGTGPIHHNYLECTGDESTLSQCPSCAECLEGAGSCFGHDYDGAVDCFPQGGECTDEDLRLVEGDTIYSGRLEICHAGYWGTICGFNYLWDQEQWVFEFTTASASVACRQLGFSPEGAVRAFAPVVDSGPIFLEEVRCQGDEERLSDCPHAPVNEFGSCYHWGDIALTCQACTDYDVRLADGLSETEGRVEVCLGGEWGTICHNYWDARDARVVCRQLGYESDTAIGIHSYGGGQGLINLDYVHCDGGETHLSECPPCTFCAGAQFIGCDHHQDAGVICFPNGTSMCNDTDVRLVGGSDMYEGRVEVCYHGIWGSVCAWHWNWQTLSYNSEPFFPVSGASVICRQLGFQSEGASIVPMDRSSKFTDTGSLPIYLDNTVCTGQESKLSDCEHSPLNEHLCWHEVDLGVVCLNRECSEGAIRLTGGTSVGEGRVELCSDGFWGTICHNYWDARDARVVCRQLGYQSDNAVGLLEYTGGQGQILRDYVQCDGDESTLKSCPECSYCTNFFANCDHFTDAGVICFPNSTECQCNETDVRLVGGSSEHDGTVEICHNGLWGTICGWHRNWQTNTDVKFFRDIDASVLCNQLGFSTNGATVVDMGFYPLVTGLPIYLDNVRCSGTEDNILECDRSDWNVHECWHEGDVGISCQVGSSGESSTSPGTIGGAVAAVIIIISLVAVVIIVFLVVRRRRFVKESTRTESMFAMDEMETFRNQVQASNSSASNTYLESGALGIGSARRGTVINKEAVELIEEIPEDMMIPSDTLRLLDTLGQGEFGIVYKAHLIKPLTAPRPEKNGSRRRSTIRKGSAGSISSNPAEPLTVAVKTLKGYFAEGEITEMIKESVKMQQFDHDNVLSLMGICIDAGPAPYIVMPFMANGSLISYLKKERASLILTVDADEDDVCTVKKRLIDMCVQVAKGMEYLSSMKVIHRDLAARNCMIDVDWIIKVADFGLSESTASKDYFRQDQDASVKLPIKWMAPESLSDGVFSEKTDVWSFGITCWEVFSGGKGPYPGIHPIDVISLLENGKRLEKPTNASCCDLTYSVLHSCWEADPADRPTFSLLVQSLNRLLGSLSDYLDVSTFQEIPGNKNTLDALHEESSVDNSMLFENKGTDPQDQD